MAVEPVPAELLYRSCDLGIFDFETTSELTDLPQPVGQERALEALDFGTAIRRPGYNLFVLGPEGAGKHETVLRFLSDLAGREPPPSDWVYVNNFHNPQKPLALKLSPGAAPQLKELMAHLVEDMRVTLPAILEGDEYRSRRLAVDEEFRERQEQLFDGLRAKADAQGMSVLRTPAGFAIAPVHREGPQKGEVLKPEEFNTLPESERKSIEQANVSLQKELAETLEQLPGWEKEHRIRVQALNHEVAERAVQRAMRDLRQQFCEMPGVAHWLDMLAKDLVENAALFVMEDAGQQGVGQVQTGEAAARVAAGAMTSPVRRYGVNIIVTRGNGGKASASGASVVFEDYPTLANLVGRVEYMPQMGGLITDFMMIKPGALHRANGGYLLIDAAKLLREPLSWEALKRTLRRGQIVIETPAEFLTLVNTVSLEPDPVPLSLKVVLLGERYLYYMLSNLDPEFAEFFKIAADFEDVIDREPENDLLYARLLAGLCRDAGLLPLDRSGVGRVVERASRLAEDAEKLTTLVRPIRDLLQEADFIARKENAAVISAEHIENAVEAQIRRADRMRERSLEMITRDIIMIDTEGECIGQVNGLSVLSMGSVSFGRPSRITARVRMGMGGTRVLDIEREVDLGGPIHSKGVLILSGYLSATFLPEIPFSMSASLVFEQSYGGIDGDSASSAELYALISALSEMPIAQGFAVTGSVNQRGEVQAIGGVNDKIEGFFDICMRRGLTGDQGVLIPAANVKHLMLRQDVIDAVERGVFTIYPVEHIEQGVELLMGAPAGTRGADGNFPPNTIYARAEARLAAFADNQRRYAQQRADDNGRHR